jgi:hypothetical protein
MSDAADDRPDEQASEKSDEKSTEKTESDTDGPGLDSDVSEEDKKKIEEERKERLDADNRPDNAEIDNSDRTFDATSGQFTDDEEDDGLGPFEDEDPAAGTKSDDDDED